MSGATPRLTFSSALRRLQAHQLVAPAGPWSREPVRVDPDLPQFLAVPVVYGNCVACLPELMAVPRTRDGGDASKLLVVVKTLGRGPLQLSNLRMGEEDLVSGPLEIGKRTKVESSPFGPFRYEALEGRPGDGGLRLYPANLATDVFTDLKLGKASGSDRTSFKVRRTPKGTVEVDVKLWLPHGLSKKRADGTWKAESIKIHVYAWEKGSGEQKLTNHSLTIQGADDDRAFPVTFPGLQLESAAEWDIGVRVNPAAERLPVIHWTHLVSRGVKSLGAAAGQAVIAIEADLTALSTDQFLKGLTVDATPELRETIGGAAVATRSPAAAFLDCFTGSWNTRPLPDSRIDAAAISAWNSACAAAGLRFDFKFGGASGNGSRQDALKLICAAGRARPVVVDGKHSVIREPSGNPAWLYCPANMRPGFRVLRDFGDTLHGIRCSYRDNLARGAERSFVVFAAGFDQGTAHLFEDWRFDGTTDRDAVKSLAAYHLAVLSTRGKTYEVPVDIEHLRVVRGDLVRLAHWRIRKGSSWGRVKRVPAADEIDVSRDCEMETGGSYVIRMLAADGSLSSRNLVTVPGTTRTLRTDSAHGAAEGDIFVFGELDEDTEVCVVLKVAHGPQRSAVLHLAPFGQDVADAVGFTASAEAGSAASAVSSPTLSPVSNRGGISFSL